MYITGNCSAVDSDFSQKQNGPQPVLSSQKRFGSCTVGAASESNMRRKS